MDMKDVIKFNLENKGRCIYLSRKNIESLDITMNDVISSVEGVFYEKGNGEVEMPPKPGIHPREESFIHAMPAFIPKMGAAGVKWVSGFLENYKYNLPYITGLLILNSPETGVPIAIMDCTWITEMRTAAVTAVSAKYFARKDSNSVAIIGCGVQGRSNLIALNTIMDLNLVKAYDRNNNALTKYIKDMEKLLKLEIHPVDSPEKAVTGSDIIVTATPILKEPKPVIKKEWLKEGCLGLPLDFDSYWKPDAINFADKIYVDDKEQFEYYRSLGYFSHVSHIYGELGEVIVGNKKGREKSNERIISINLGLAIEDMAIAIEILKKALEKNIGEILEL